MLNTKNLTELSSNLEMPLVNVLATMEYSGIHLDKHALAELAGQLREDLCKLETDIFGHAGTEFNIQSPKQLGDILFEKLGIDSGNKKQKQKRRQTKI
ncbi:MAG: hypothetical protein HC905_20675 [Bacteroidales bacterium]|nr:hypothetical protein [Bacteroidales bacterium]